MLEVIWTGAALPGLVVWAVNLRSARRSLRAVHLVGVVNGRLRVARYGVRQGLVMLYASGVFVLIGVNALLRPVNPAAPEWDALRVLLTIGLISAPALISYLGLDWRRVEVGVLQRAPAARKES